jgi:hypothetical protein
LSDIHEVANSFDKTVDRLLNEGWPEDQAMLRAVEDHLDGKPRLSGKRKITRAERDRSFWDSALVRNLAVERWKDPAYTLALAQYFAQDRIANDAVILRLALEEPGVICTAARQAGIVSRADSQRRRDLNQLASSSPGHCRTLCRSGHLRPGT